MSSLIWLLLGFPWVFLLTLPSPSNWFFQVGSCQCMMILHIHIIHEPANWVALRTVLCYLGYLGRECQFWSWKSWLWKGHLCEEVGHWDGPLIGELGRVPEIISGLIIHDLIILLFYLGVL